MSFGDREQYSQKPIKQLYFIKCHYTLFNILFRAKNKCDSKLILLAPINKRERIQRENNVKVFLFFCLRSFTDPKADGNIEPNFRKRRMDKTINDRPVSYSV